jgi:hypothetical protein
MLTTSANKFLRGGTYNHLCVRAILFRLACFARDFPSRPRLIPHQQLGCRSATGLILIIDLRQGRRLARQRRRPILLRTRSTGSVSFGGIDFPKTKRLHNGLRRCVKLTKLTRAITVPQTPCNRLPHSRVHVPISMFSPITHTPPVRQPARTHWCSDGSGSCTNSARCGLASR